MVSFRRTVRTEQDREGGYGLSPVKRSEISDTDTESFSINVGETVHARNIGRMTERDGMAATVERERVSIPAEMPRKKSEFEYSGREDYPSTAEFVGYDYVAPSRMKKSPRREKEDFMPSIAGAQKPAVKPAAATEVRRKERAQLSSKAKAMLFLYMGIVAIMAVAVIGIGIAVSNVTAQVSGLEQAIASRSEVVARQNSDIERITDLNYIAGVAMGGNPDTGAGGDMERIDTAVQVEGVQLSSPITYEERTNWFDRFCDWISNLIGG